VIIVSIKLRIGFYPGGLAEAQPLAALSSWAPGNCDLKRQVKAGSAARLGNGTDKLASPRTPPLATGAGGF
jgi:hypothetical protein